MTGPTSGLGLAMAERITCDSRFQPIFLCRNETRREDLRARLGDEKARYLVCDFATLSGVRTAATRLCSWLRSEEIAPLGAVVLNAAVHPGAVSGRTAEGLDATLVTNLIGPHLLVALLSPHVGQHTALNLVFVGSGANSRRRWWTGLPATVEPSAETMFEAGGLPGPQAYAVSKRATVRLCRAYTARMPERTAILSYDPGIMAGTEIARNMPRISRWVVRKLFPLLTGVDGFSTPQRSADWLCDMLARGALPVGMSYAKVDGFSPTPSIALDDRAAEDLFDAINAVAGVTETSTAEWWWDSRDDHLGE
ncbi:SDR family NAD(P)-dependent oxidoreductase [Mycolicibacterium neoaurum]|uniref:SDR family NAD(P)-dependent oxidoreductase n=1 Tax=Mycolicibacterium neoaurum TaxID=1795 RepID=UPI0032B24068